MVIFVIDYSKGRFYTMEQFEQQYSNQVNNFQQNDEQPKTVFGGLALGFGIASIVIFWIPFVGLILGILGIVFAILAKRVVGMRIAGAICSGIGTFLSLIITGLLILGLIITSNVDSVALLEQELNNVTLNNEQQELVGIWQWDVTGADWYSFRADGTAVNLNDGEEFTWNEDGTLNAIIYTRWEINNGILTIHNSLGSSFNYRRR